MNAGQLSVRDVVARLKALEDGERVTLLAEFADAFGPLLTRTLGTQTQIRSRTHEPTTDCGSGHLWQRTAHDGRAAAHAVFLQSIKASAPVRATLWSFSLLMVSDC